MESLEHRDVPVGDLAYALQLSGLGNNANIRFAADAAGNSYAVGTFTGTIDIDPAATITSLTSNGGTDVFVAKFSTTGALVWAKAVGGTADDRASDVAFDGAGGVYVSGTFNDTADFDPGAAINAMAAATNGSAFVWKLDVSGNLVFARMVEGTSTANSLAIDAQGNIVVTGQYQGSADFNPSPTLITRLTTVNPNGAGYLWKIGSTGAMVWAKDIDGTGTIAPTAISMDGAGNVYFGGRLSGSIDFDPTAIMNLVDGGANGSPIVAKYNTYGNLQWARAATGGSAVTGSSNSVLGIEYDSAGNVYAGGTFAGTIDVNPDPLVVTGLTSTSGSADAFVWKLSSAGATVWAKQMGGAGNETVGDFSVDTAGNSYTVGTFTGTGDFDPNTAIVNLVGGTNPNAFVAKLTPTGTLGYARSLGGGTSTVTPTGVWADGAGNIYTAGVFTGTSDFDPALEVGALTSDTSAGYLVKLAPGTNPNPAPPTTSTNPNPDPDPTPTLTVTTSGPYTINEGQGLSVAANVVYTGKRALSYSWDLNGNNIFGDFTGKSFTLTPSQMLSLGLNDSRPNPITVKVRVSDGVNPAVIASTTLTINNVGPKAKVTGPTNAKQGDTVQLGYTKPGEQSWADYYAGYRYSFDFNNDGVWDVGNGKFGGSGTNSTPVIPARFLGGSGAMVVKARVIDKDNGFTESTLTINVQNIAPTGTFTLLSNAFVNQPTTFAFTNVKDASSVDVQQGLVYAYDFNGDGVFETVTQSSQVNFTYNFSGVQIVRGRIYDMHGGFTDYSLTINVV